MSGGRWGILVSIFVIATGIAAVAETPREGYEAEIGRVLRALDATVLPCVSFPWNEAWLAVVRGDETIRTYACAYVPLSPGDLRARPTFRAGLSVPRESRR